MKKIAIFGCSGFALEVADICSALGYKEIILLSDNGVHKQTNGLEVRSEKDVILLHEEGYFFAIGIGDGSIRRKIVDKFPELTFPNLIHPSAVFGINQVAAFDKYEGNIITSGVIFTNSIAVGNHGLYNLNVTIGHDCIIDDFISIMPSVSVSGNVHLKKGCTIGVGAVILQGNASRKLVIGESAMVGAQSLVTKDVLAQMTVFGIPARVIKE